MAWRGVYYAGTQGYFSAQAMEKIISSNISAFQLYKMFSMIFATAFMFPWDSLVFPGCYK